MSYDSRLEKCHKNGIRCLADIVINHRCGDGQDDSGRWNQFSSGMRSKRQSFIGVADWGGWAVTLGDRYSDGTGVQKKPYHLIRTYRWRCRRCGDYIEAKMMQMEMGCIDDIKHWVGVLDI